MLVVALASLFVSLLVVGVAAAYLVARARELLRQFRTSSGALRKEADAVELALASAGSRADLLAARSGEVGAATDRLAVSRARLSVVLSAWREVRDAVGHVTAAVPRK